MYPVSIYATGSSIAPGLIDTVSANIKIMLNALGVPTVGILYFRMNCTAISQAHSHLFVAIDERQRVVEVPSARLAMITSTINPVKIKEFTASMTSDPLGALLMKSNGSAGERVHRFPPIFGFKAPRGERVVYDRRPEIEALRRDGYFAMTFLPVVGVDHRMQLAIEIASLWGISIAAHDSRWPDLLVLRNDTPDRDDLGGVPDETWLNHALSRVMEDHLPVVELDGLWMGSLSRSRSENFNSRSKVYYAVLDWFRMRRLPYITARTFHCYVRRDLSAVIALGSLRDRLELTEWLNLYPFEKLSLRRVKGEVAAAQVVFASIMNIAVKDSSTDEWLIISGPQADSRPDMPVKDLEKIMRDYYSKTGVCGLAGSPVTAKDLRSMSLEGLLKVIRIAECEAASGICFSGQRQEAPAGSFSHRAYRAAIRTHTLRTHDSLGVYRLGPRASPFFMFDVHQYIAMPPESRYRAMVSELSLAPDIGASEDALLKALVGTVWLFTVHEPATASAGAPGTSGSTAVPTTEIDVMRVASDRDGEEVRKTLFDAWKSGHMIGTWCRVMLLHRETLSISVAGGTVDPLLAHAGDSVVDGNRWLDLTRRTLTQCAS
jgi:hypothetical protein